MVKMDWEVRARLAKPCPFCGSRKVITESREHFEAGETKTCCYIECADCGATIYGDPVRDESGRFVEDYNTAQRGALKAWNRRAA